MTGHRSVVGATRCSHCIMHREHLVVGNVPTVCPALRNNIYFHQQNSPKIQELLPNDEFVAKTLIPGRCFSLLKELNISIHRHRKDMLTALGKIYGF